MEQQRRLDEMQKAANVRCFIALPLLSLSFVILEVYSCLSAFPASGLFLRCSFILLIRWRFPGCASIS